MSSRIAVALIGIAVACSSKPDSQPAAQPDPPKPDPKPQPDVQTKPQPAAPSGALPSLPKVDWPCARRDIEGKAVTIARYHYTKAESCLLPLELINEGVVGCVERIDTTPNPIKVTYDGQRLIALDMYTVDWTGGTAHEVGHKVGLNGNQLECHRGDGSLHWRLMLDGTGRPQHMDNFGKTDGKNPELQIDYTWQGGRLASFQMQVGPNTTRYEMIYDCSKL